MPSDTSTTSVGLPQVVGNQPSAKARTRSAPVADKQRSSPQRATPNNLAPATRSLLDLRCCIVFRVVVAFPVFDAAPATTTMGAGWLGFWQLGIAECFMLTEVPAFYILPSTRA
ncbi:hypothetical protein BDV41DRAFT_524202 [Aspergillus transmontanensis]|uniref:Uncharacterized protein n=1 Tax=Aspergillus transmontanensis TaxID=1034304 RepID=A0A5N6WAX2_9EURO|nr:hypothetical protein BDV41DRAFT_524202 [Aspergillus transmontanensis]